MVLGEIEHANDKTGEQVALDVGIVLLDPLGHEGAEAGAAHVGRVGYHTVVAASEDLAGLKSTFQFIFRTTVKQTIGADEFDRLTQCGKVALTWSEQRADLVQMR